MGNVTAKTSGEIASFMTPAETNITSLKVHFSPKQLGEGDPSPENVREIVGWDGVEVNGCGKNLFDKNQSIDNYRLKTDGTNYSATGYYISPFIPVKTGQLYIKNSPSIDAYHRFCTYTTNDPKAFVRRIDNINHVTIESNETYIRFCGEITEKDTAQVELGSTATSYEPYQGNNISTNWTKNIKQWTYTDTTIDDSYSSNNFNGYGNGRWDNVITDIPSEWFGKELVYSAYIERSSSPLNEYDDVRVWCYGESTTLFDAKTAQRIYTAEESRRSWVTFTIPEGTTKIGLGLYLSKGGRAYNPQLEYGSEPTEYQPYVGTIYSGYVDLISGELVEEYANIRLNAETSCNEFRVLSNGKFTVWSSVTGMKSSFLASDEKALCDKAIKTESYKDNTALEILLGNNNSSIYLYNMNTIYNLTTIEQISTWLEENPIHVTVPLATPITYQLTPTQLSSFIGQNNFWSNADYVEVEYELKETEDIQKARKKIILNQPQLKTVSNKVVSFNTDMVAPMKNCKIYFNPIQLGSGDPSPTNVRNINGWTSIDSYANGNKVSVDWTNDIGTIYGGYVDLVKGELVAEYESISDTWGNWGTLYDQGDGTELRYKKFTNSIIGNSAGSNSSYCNIAKYKYNNTDGTIHFYNVTTSNNCRIYLPSGTDTSLQIQVVAKLAEPIHYQLTPQQLLTFKGKNNIWSNSNGQTEVKFWTH